MASDSSISVSVVVPVHSGEAFLLDLIDQLAKVRADWRRRDAPMDLSEVILVDDSSVDGSPALLDVLATEHNWLNVVHMMRSFGRHAATTAGILHSSGDWVVTLDENLKHPPAEIEALLRHAVIEGSDIVYARPASAMHDARSRNGASNGFRRLMVFLTGNANILHFNSFRLIRGPLARAASSVCGHETYFDMALSWFTDRVRFQVLEFNDQRFIGSGQDGHGLSGLLTHARRLLMSSKVKLLRLFGLVGIGVVAASTIGAVALLVETVLSPGAIVMTGWASLMLTIMLFGAIITFMIALALEYLSTLVLAAHGKPSFFAVDRSIDEPLARYFASQAA